MKKAIINILAVLAIILLSNQFANSQVIKAKPVPYAFKAPKFKLGALIVADRYKCDTLRIINVQSGTTVIKIDRQDVNYIFNHVNAAHWWALAALRQQPQTIRNNDLAGLIIAVIKARK